MRSGDVKAFLIIVLSLAIVFVLCLIFAEADKKQSENNAKAEIEEDTEIQQQLDLKNFVIDDDGGFYVIEALLVPEEWSEGWESVRVEKYE